MFSGSACPTPCSPMDYTSRDASVHGILGKNTGGGWHFLLQGVFPDSGMNLCVLYLLRLWALSVMSQFKKQINKWKQVRGAD